MIALEAETGIQDRIISASKQSIYVIKLSQRYISKARCVTLVGCTGSGSLTGTVYERPIEALLFGAAAGLQGNVVGRALLARLQRSLHGASVGALHAQAFPRAAGIAAPAALGLLQALGARLQS